MRARIGSTVESDKRQFKITGTPAAHGEYAHPIHWKMTAADVTVAGRLDYYAKVNEWAASVLLTLRESGNLNPLPIFFD